MDIEEIFGNYFITYCEKNNKKNLKFLVTSRFREGNPLNNPHSIKGNAIDFILKQDGSYAAIEEYNNLFAEFLKSWPYRAGIDNTWIGEEVGNVHIHLDLGQNKPAGQLMPFFFKENGGLYLRQIKEVSQIT
jgi:hypothetical protein